MKIIHWYLGCPSVKRQVRVTENAELKNLPSPTRKDLAHIGRHCLVCQLNHGRPRRVFLFGCDLIVVEFNHEVQVDTVSLLNGNVLFIVDMGTRSQNGGFMGKMRSNTARKLFCRFQIDIYAGRPDYIITYAETNFNFSELKGRAECMGIVGRIVPTEIHKRIGTVNQSHAYLRLVLRKAPYGFTKHA